MLTLEDVMPFEVFISYAHKDRELQDELATHLSLLRRQNIITAWYDSDIIAGTDWNEQILEHLNSARIILLLVSADFLASDFCYSTEMTQALNRHDAKQACVIPIILRPIDWRNGPFAKLQVLPTGGKPVTQWPTHDEALEGIVQGIRRAIGDLNPGLLLSTGSMAGCIEQVPIWNVPFRRNPYFTGREDILTRLHETFVAQKKAAIMQPQAISGLDDIGKTQTAIEYAYRYSDEYRAVLWVKSETHEDLVADFVGIAELLNLPEKSVQEQDITVKAVRRWLETHTGWLLIFDNADDFTMVSDYLPLRSLGDILLTTRTQTMSGHAYKVEIETMEPGEGALFLLRRAGIVAQDASPDSATTTDLAKAKELVQEMEGLPLALDQAGAYIEETRCGLVGYLALYCTQRAKLLRQRGGLVSGHPQPVATTWSLSFAKVDQANSAAAELLRFCAFLAPDAILKNSLQKVPLLSEHSYNRLLTIPSRSMQPWENFSSIRSCTVTSMFKY
jgi:hypothetical protein